MKKPSKRRVFYAVAMQDAPAMPGGFRILASRKGTNFRELTKQLRTALSQHRFKVYKWTEGQMAYYEFINVQDLLARLQQTA